MYKRQISDIAGTGIAESTALTAVVFLEGLPSPAEPNGSDKAPAIEFLLDRSDPVLFAKAVHFPGVDRVSHEESGGFTTLRIEGQNLGGAVVEIEVYCRDHRICVLDAASPVGESPTFTEIPTLTRVESKYALGTLAQQFLPGRGSVILREEYQGQSSKLILEMIRLFQGVPFFRLRVGEMSQMIGLVEQLAYGPAGNVVKD